jgi:hypothetical protein
MLGSALLRILKQVDEFGNGESEDRQVARDVRDVKSDRIHAFATMALLALLATWRSAVLQPTCKNSVGCAPRMQP